MRPHTHTHIHIHTHVEDRKIDAACRYTHTFAQRCGTEEALKCVHIHPHTYTHIHTCVWQVQAYTHTHTFAQRCGRDAY